MHLLYMNQILLQKRTTSAAGNWGSPPPRKARPCMLLALRNFSGSGLLFSLGSGGFFFFSQFPFFPSFFSALTSFPRS